MDLPDFNGLTNEEVASLVKKAIAETLQSRAGSLHPLQASIAVEAVNEEYDTDWRSKTLAIIHALTSREQLEAAGHSLSLAQALELLGHPQEIHKLPQILVGMPLSRFIELIASASDKQLEILKQESVSEPVQHHLNNFYHEMHNKLAEKSQEIEQISLTIEELRIDELGREELVAIFSQLNEFRDWFAKALQDTARALLLAWNTNRLDLIEKLSHIKDNCHRFSIHVIGHPNQEEGKPTGLFALLEEKLNSVYGNPNNPADAEALQNDEPSIDAIVKFSVWYLRDYWEIGLLPSIEYPEELDLAPQEHKEKLFNMAQSNLERVGLATVQDLKKAHIYSKKTLNEYILEHHDTLKKE